MSFRWAGICAGVAACYSPTAPLGAPCSTTSECPTGQLCDELTDTCLLPTELRTWRDDTAAELAASAGSLDGAAIEPTGFVGPAAYLTGRIRLAGIADALIADGSTTWDSLVAAPITGTSFASNLRLDFGNGRPAGLGLPQDDDITVLVEGEIYLDAPGAWQFQLTANDRGFLELAAPGGAFTRVIDDDFDTTVGSFTVVAPGWHRIRGAASDSMMFMELTVRVDPPNMPGNFRDIVSDDLRARVDDLAGLVVDGFDDLRLLEPRGSTLVVDPLGGAPLGFDAHDLPVGASWSLRTVGQILIDAEGDYAFEIDSHNGHRAWLDGTSLVDKLDDGPSVTVTPATHLEPGWHDLVVDVQRPGSMTDGRLAITVAAGPVWVGQPIPLDHLRPVVGRDMRWTGALNETSVTIADVGQATSSVGLELPATMMPLRLDASFAVDHPALPSLSVILDPPFGANLTIAPLGSIPGSGAYDKEVSIPTQHTGSGFTLLVKDETLDLLTGHIVGFAVTLLYAGGVAPVPAAYSVESSPRDLGEVVAWGALTWATRQDLGDGVRVQFRSCADADGCASESWVDVTQGAVPTAPPDRFAQYRVAFTSDGDRPTALDWIELAYSARVEH